MNPALTRPASLLAAPIPPTLSHPLQVLAHPKYVPMVPNGDKITGYAAIGHTAPAGGGAANAFGAAFSANGKVWDVTLACADSDSDGWSNGVELGDGCGQWTAATGRPSPASSGLSHPGLRTSVPANGANNCTTSPDPCKKPEVLAAVAALESRIAVMTRHHLRQAVA